MKIVNNTDKAVVVRWKNPDPNNRVNVTLIKLFPHDHEKTSEVLLPEDILDDTIYIQHVEDCTSE